jgi:hypothetical protein
MGVGDDVDRGRQGDALQPRQHALAFDKAGAALGRRPGIEGRPVAALRRDGEIVAAPKPAQQRNGLARAWPFRHRDDVRNVGIAGENALGSLEHQHVDRGVGIRARQAADQRRGEQHVAEPAQRDD